MAIEELKAGDIITLVSEAYEERIKKVQLENAELKYYKALAEHEFEQDVIAENIRLQKQLDKLSQELECFRKFGTPF